MTPKRRFLIWLLSVMMAGLLGACAGWLFARTKAAQSSDPTEPLAFLDNVPITRADVEKLQPSYRGELVAQVMLSRLVYHAGGPKQIKVGPKEIAYPRYLRTTEEYAAFGALAHFRLFLDKLALADWPEARLRRFYTLFKAELTQYDINFLRLARPEDSALVQADLEGDIEFQSLIARYASDEAGQKLAWQVCYRRCDLEEVFGEQLAEELITLGPGRRSVVLRKIGDQVYVFQLSRVIDQFDKLRPDLESRIVRIRRTELCYELLREARVTLGQPLGQKLQVLDFRL